MKTLFTKLGDIRRVSVIDVVDNYIAMSKAIILNSKLWFAGVALLVIEYLYSHLATLRIDFEYDIISSAIWPWFAEILLFGLIFFGFFYYLYTNDKKEAVLNFIVHLIYSFGLYIIIVMRGLSYFKCLPVSYIVCFNGTLIIDGSTFISRMVIGSLCLLFLVLLYIDSIQAKFFVLELPFLIGLLFWFFLISVFSFNFFFLFIVMEVITLSIVVITTLYFVFVGPKLVRPIIQFFILNLMISTFYLLGVSLLLFIVPNQEAYSLSYSTILTTYWFLADYLTDLTPYYYYFKLVIALILVPLVFKLTLAPFSIWIVNVYTNLPMLFLLLLMTIYKVVYTLIFIKLFVTIITFIPTLTEFWVNSIILFVVPSMFVGCLAFRTQDLKTILAYTTVSQLGYVMSGIICNDAVTLRFSLIYLGVYCLQLFGIFIIFIILQSKYNFTNLNHLYLVKKYNKFYYYSLLIIFFSLSGIPPLSGFLVKYFLFLLVHSSHYLLLAVAGLVSGFIMSIIYLQIVLQLMYVKQDHYSIEMFEHSKKNFLIMEPNLMYTRFISVLNIFLIGLIILNIAFFFFLPEISDAISPYVDYLIFTGNDRLLPQSPHIENMLILKDNIICHNRKMRTKALKKDIENQNKKRI